MLLVLNKESMRCCPQIRKIMPRCPAGKDGAQMNKNAASKLGEIAGKLIRLAQARLEDVSYQEPQGEAKTYASMLPEPLQELQAR